MRSSLFTLFGAFFTLCWSLTAYAGPQEAPRSAEIPNFLILTNFSLDLALEEFVARSGKSVMHGLSGPSSMDCRAATYLDGVETCVVTARRTSTSVPASLATR
jgi:hypothetical protein